MRWGAELPEGATKPHTRPPPLVLGAFHRALPSNMPDHSYFANLIWQIADLLRGPYRPPQYERVMLPMTVLRRFDCVLAPTKAKLEVDALVAEADRLALGIGWAC